MKFTAVVAAVLSMAAFAIAAPIDVDARQVAASGNHGMCVKATAGNLEQIPDC
ncbi:hypothetical protein K458DRAFT_387492 [Lentithecium fluviatile CBS 122367]|uniref:Uncharacterized protein n=1 Tax=Lentithecium fluviatile CBS 122367 TaxID=1168545 RepID=A0A6G1J540_9PLEO|nr:hypothetical protein K458DRAFT_387492 [Lentithecium fluviatile CBS 122367]